MSNYQDQLIMELRLRGYSKDTERSYVYHVSRFEALDRLHFTRQKN